jgi:integrase
VNVQRQVKLIGHRLVFALPKYGKTREVPLPDSVARWLDDYLARFPARTVTLPWKEPDSDELVTVRLVVTSREGKALNRTYFNPAVWKRGLAKVGIAPTRENGTHALRHLYASVLLDEGENVKALSEYLGHADPGFTLRVYTHLMKASAERTRRAIDAFLSPAAVKPDYASRVVASPAVLRTSRRRPGPGS